MEPPRIQLGGRRAQADAVHDVDVQQDPSTAPPPDEAPAAAHPAQAAEALASGASAAPRSVCPTLLWCLALATKAKQVYSPQMHSAGMPAALVAHICSSCW